MASKQSIVQGWLTELATHMRPSIAERDLKARIRVVSRELAGRYPDLAFTIASGKAVSDGLIEFPTGDVIAARLATWWADNGPPSSRELPGGDDRTLTRDDRYHLRAWLTLKGEGFPHVGGNMAVSLSVFRQYQPRVFDHICRTDPAAEKIAMGRGWLVDASDRMRGHTNAEIASVEQSMARALAALPLYRRAHPVNDQRDAAAGAERPFVRTRADDLALLENLRGNPAAPNRDARMARLRETLGLAP